MIRKHMTITLALLVLFAAFALVSCDDSNPIEGGGGNEDPITAQVQNLSLSLSDSNLEGYFGSKDTVTVIATATNNAGEAVENAKVTITSSNFGTVSYLTDNTTDENGQVTARLIVTFVDFGENNTTEVLATAGATVKSSARQVSAATNDIRVQVTATPSNAVALAGQMATSDIRTKVLDSVTGVAVAGVPIRVEIINGADAILSAPTYDAPSKSYTSTLTVEEVQGTIDVQVRASVNVPGAQIASIAGLSAELPVTVPGKESPEVDAAGTIEAGEANETTPVTDAAPILGKGGVALNTWKAADGPGDKGGRTLAESVVADTVMVHWTVWGSSISEIYLSISPSKVKAMPNESKQLTVTAVAADENNNGIRGLQLYLKLRNLDPTEPTGTITVPTVTDSAGKTTAIVSTNGEYGTWIVEARTTPTQEDPWTDTLTVTSGSEVVAAFLSVDPNMIFAEPGVSAKATVRAIAYNERNNGVPDYELHMTLRDPNGTPIGASIAQPDSTDSTGTALTTIQTNGDYGDWVVEVRAYEDQEEPLATKSLNVVEGSAISSINMILSETEVFAEPDANKEIDVWATARDDNSSALENRLVYFKLVSLDGSSTGTIAYSDTTDTSGVAHTVINTEGQTGEWRVEARAYPTQNNALAQRDLDIIEGSAVTDISVTVSPNILTPAPGAADTAQVRLVAYDADGAGVPDAELHLSVRNMISGELAGSVSEPDSTGEDGGVIAQLLTNGRYGDWIVEARPYQGHSLVFRDTVKVKPGSPQYIIAVPDTNSISVRGTNGLEQTDVTATLYTENDLPTLEDQWIYFRTEEFPYTTGEQYRLRINDNYGQGSPFPDPRDPVNGQPFDSVFSENGEATVTITAGGTKGHIRLRIWTKDQAGEEDIFTRFNGLQIVSGPPASIDADYNPTPYDGGAAVWDLEVNARVFDARGNDVLDGYTVYFAVDTLEYAHINDRGVTGNESEHTTQVTPGVCYTTLEYNSEDTNQNVTVTAWVLDKDGQSVSDEVFIHLPIAEPTGVLTVQPANYDFGDHPGDYGIFELRLDVFDGHGYPIDRQLVSFSPAKGRIFKTDDINGQPQPFAYTGRWDYPLPLTDFDETGVANRYFLISEGEAFPDPSVGETQVQITAEILGVSDASVEPVTVFLIRDISPE
ncbi:Ig-like domain-containing protein [bacterium]|nr:Ig-like domain-containing protein [bacterium]